MVALLIVGMASLYVVYGLRVAFFQNDEEQYMELARYVAGHFPSALWLGEIYPRGPQRLDALILAIPFAIARGPWLYQLAHGIQALMFASTALPVFLLARRAALGRAASLFASALTLVVPWAIVSTSFLAESAAYPAYAWVLYLTWRVLERPGWPREALLALAVALAILSRTAMLALVPLPALAVIWHESHCEQRAVPLRERPRAVATALFTRYRLIALAIVAGLLVLVLDALGLLPGRGLAGATGGYGLPQAGSLSALLGRYHEYLSRMATGTSLFALALALPWIVLALVRPAGRRESMLATVCGLGLLGVLASILQAGPDERYVLYSAVPISLAAAAALAGVRDRPGWELPRAIGVLTGTGIVLALVLTASWPPLANAYDFFTYPSAIFYRRVLLERGAAQHVPLVHPSVSLLLAVVLVVVAVAWVLLGRSRRTGGPAAAVLALGLVGLCFTQLLYDMRKFTQQVGAEGPYADQRSWVDEAAPDGASVGALAMGLGEASSYLPIWRELQFWNTSLNTDVLYKVDGTIPVPLGNDEEKLQIATGSGRLETYGVQGPGSQRPLPRYLVIPLQATNTNGLDGAVVATSTYLPLQLIRLNEPARALWSVLGTTPEGFIPPDQSAIVTFYDTALAGSRKSCATFRLIAPPAYSGRLPYAIRSGHQDQAGSLLAGAEKQLRVPLFPVRSSGEETATMSVSVSAVHPTQANAALGAKLAYVAAEPCK